MEERAQLLINILLDTTAREDERDDAAIDLRHFNDSEVIDVLFKVASNPHEIDTIVDTSGQSLGVIWLRMNKLDLLKIK